MKMSDKGLAFLAEVEGKGPFKDGKYWVYKDVAGYETIGVGHLLTPVEKNTSTLTINGKGVNWQKGLTEQELLYLLKQDVTAKEDAVNVLVKAKLTQDQFDAITSFAFNCGQSALMKSTLLKKLNAGDYNGAREQFKVWNKAGGKTVHGLVNRRQKEIDLWDGK